MGGTVPCIFLKLNSCSCVITTGKLKHGVFPFPKILTTSDLSSIAGLSAPISILVTGFLRSRLHPTQLRSL